MLDSKKYITKEQLTATEEEVARLQKGVDFYKDIMRGGKDAVKAALELIKRERDKARSLKNAYLMDPHMENEKGLPVDRTLETMGSAHREEAFNFVVTLFEDPKIQMDIWESALAGTKRHLDELKKLPLRKD
jgi:hypothetical protein